LPQSLVRSTEIVALLFQVGEPLSGRGTLCDQQGL